MNISNIGMESRIRYEVSLYHLVRGNEDLKDWIDADNYRNAVKTAKMKSLNEGITHTEVVKNIEFFYPNDPEQVWDTQIERRWIFRGGKMTSTTEW